MWCNKLFWSVPYNLVWVKNMNLLQFICLPYVLWIFSLCFRTFVSSKNKAIIFWFPCFLGWLFCLSSNFFVGDTCFLIECITFIWEHARNFSIGWNFYILFLLVSNWNTIFAWFGWPHECWMVIFSTFDLIYILHIFGTLNYFNL